MYVTTYALSSTVLPAHHCAVGVGQISSKLHKLGELLNLEVVQVC
ncbi:hypothetical protein [Mucilaginibacter sp.]